jgi:hypothetical protein
MRAAAPWQLEPAPPSARAWLLALTVGLPVVVTGVALGVAAGGDELSLIAGSLPVTIALIMAGVAAFGAIIAFVIDRAMRRHHVTVDADGVEVATTFYKRRLAWGELRVDEARVVDLDEHTQLKPLLKTNGTAFPGFRSGWFRLRNREKALVAMLSGPRVAWVPTTQGFGLLLQARQAQALLDHLRAHGAAR